MNVKIVVYVPVNDAQMIRDVMHEHGAGNIGDYSHCSFSSCGIGRFTPGKSSDPTIGEVGKPEEVEEERIEVLCPKDRLQAVIEAMKHAHPYEEVAYDVYERLEV